MSGAGVGLERDRGDVRLVLAAKEKRAVASSAGALKHYDKNPYFRFRSKSTVRCSHNRFELNKLCIILEMKTPLNFMCIAHVSPEPVNGISVRSGLLSV
jgi:hypothetical protein